MKPFAVRLFASLVIVACGGIAALLLTCCLNRVGAQSDAIVYDDALASGWQDWSWNSARDFANVTPARDARSIAVTFQQGWAGLSLRSASPLSGADYQAVAFWVHGGDEGTRSLQFFIQQADGGSETPAQAVDAPAGVWTPFTITLSSLGNPAVIKRLNLMDRSGAAQPTFYVDDVRLIGRGGEGSNALTATITIQANGPITPVSPRLRASNLPAWLGAARFNDATFRARTAASGLTLLRMPGGSWSNDYGWLSCELGQNAPGRLDCGDNWQLWVARPRDFIAFLEATGMEGAWVVSPNGTAHEAAAAVAYFNGLITDTRTIGVDIRGTDWYTVGHWAALRAASGHPEPVGIRLWEFGNEVYGSRPDVGGDLCQPWGWESTWTCDGYEYVRGKGSGASRREGYLEFRAAMKRVDPTIGVGAVGYEWPGAPTDGRSQWDTFAGWGSRVISAAGADLDFYVVHPYAYYELPADPAAVLANPQTHWPAIFAAIQAAFDAYASGQRAPIAVTEFNLVSVQDQDDNQLMTRAVNALFLADSIGQAARQGASMLAQWDLANGRASNGTEYGLMHEDNRYYRAPQYYVYPLWAQFGSQMVPATSTLSAATHLSVYAGRVDADTISLLAINKASAPITATIVVSGFGALAGGRVWEVRATDLLAQSVTYNGSNDPSDALEEPPATFDASGPTATRVLPPYSISLFHLGRAALPSRHRLYLVLVQTRSRAIRAVQGAVGQP